MDYTQYKIWAANELFQAARLEWGYHAERFIASKQVFNTALILMLHGVSAQDVIASYSQPAFIGRKPLDSLFENSGEGNGNLETITEVQPEETRRANGFRLVANGNGHHPIEYGKRDLDVKYAHPKLRSQYRKRGSSETWTAHLATSVLRSVNRQDWDKAERQYKRLKETSSYMFFDPRLYSKLIDELGTIIGQKNSNCRVYWVRDHRGKFITGYELVEPKPKVVKEYTRPERKMGKMEYANSAGTLRSGMNGSPQHLHLKENIPGLKQERILHPKAVLHSRERLRRSFISPFGR